MWTALLLAASPFAPAHSTHAIDEEAWLARLRPPKLIQVDFTVRWQANLQGTDLGFPEDVEERLQDAKQRIDAGARDAHVLLQASTALFRMRRLDEIKRVLPACLAAYDRELEAAPDDKLLSVGKARALSMIGTLGGDDKAFEDGRTQLALALDKNRDDPRLAMDALLLTLARIGVGHRRGSLELEWFDDAEADARRAIELAPTEAGPRFGLFRAHHARGVTSNDKDILLREIEAGAMELLGAAEVLSGEDAAAVRLAGHGFLFMAGSLPRILQAGDEAEITPLDEPLIDAMDAFVAGLDELPRDDALASEVLRVFWALHCIAGDLLAHDVRLAAVVAAGLDRELTLSLATAALQLRGETERARATAEILVEEAVSDLGHAALASYFFKVDEPQTALTYVDQLSGTSGAHAGARAFAQLRLGQTEEALQSCAEAARCEDVAGGLAGDLAHARGVALALLGKFDEAERALAVAARILDTDEGLAQTLAEVRALR